MGKWERLDTATSRLEVPGGWLYCVERVDATADGPRTAVAVVFVPTSHVGDAVSCDPPRLPAGTP